MPAIAELPSRNLELPEPPPIPEDDGPSTGVFDSLSVSRHQEPRTYQPDGLPLHIKAGRDTVADQTSDLEKIVAKNITANELEQDTSPESPVTPTRPQRIHRAAMRILGRQMELKNFGELVAAKWLVHDFMGNEHPLVSKNDTPLPGRSLTETIERTDPFQPQSHVFYGSDARTIRRALSLGKERATSLHDETAAAMLKKSIAQETNDKPNKQAAVSPNHHLSGLRTRFTH